MSPPLLSVAPHQTWKVVFSPAPALSALVAVCTFRDTRSLRLMLPTAAKAGVAGSCGGLGIGGGSD